jgi:ABC-type branched-subunit amino acid transport system ATPase component
LLAVQGLTKRFGGFTAVSNVSFGVEKGEIVGLIGPNGSGKSTIFNMLSGTLAPNAGSIRFEGREIAGQPPYRIINLGIGRTFQIPRPFRRLSLLTPRVRDVSPVKLEAANDYLWPAAEGFAANRLCPSRSSTALRQAASPADQGWHGGR